MTFRISTYTATNNLFGTTQRLQVNYAKASMQQASGLRSENFEGISADAQRLLTLYADQNNLTGQALAISSAQSRLGAMQNIMSTVSDTLNKVMNLYVNVQNGLDLVAGAPSNVQQATVLRDSIVSLLNSKIGDVYLFGGSVYDRPPVDLTDPAWTPLPSPGGPDYDYYQGDNVVDSVRASDSQRVDYGILASNPAFEKVLRSLTIFINNPTNPTVITEAFDLNRQAIDETAAVNGVLLSRSNIVADAAKLNSGISAYLDDTISKLRDVDTAQAAVQLSQLETQLQASFSSMSKLLQLRLTDYLR